MNDLQHFDADLAMFQEAPRPINFAHLRFLRWLSERDRLEHTPVGPSGGEFVAPATAIPTPTAVEGERL